MLVLKGLVQYYKRDRKDFICSCVFMVVLFTFIVTGITLSSIIDN